jgi:hypothetical protein
VLRHLRAGGEGHAEFVRAAAKLFSDEEALEADAEGDAAAAAALRKRCAPPPHGDTRAGAPAARAGLRCAPSRRTPF